MLIAMSNSLICPSQKGSFQLTSLKKLRLMREKMKIKDVYGFYSKPEVLLKALTSFAENL